MDQAGRYLLTGASSGIGAGAAMMAVCLDYARQAGYRQCYLETLTGMDSAMALYQKAGFRSIDKPMGDTGHGGCDRYFVKSL